MIELLVGVAPWAFGCVVTVAVTILALTKKLPGINARAGDKQIEIGDDDEEKPKSCPEVVPGDLYAPLLVTRRRTEATNTAWSRQKMHADDVEDDFYPILDRKGLDTWQAEAVCNRLHRVLYNAADQNHILGFVTEGVVDVDYLETKLQSFRRRYEKLSARQGCTLPAFPLLADMVRSLLSSALIRFAEIAREEDAKVEAFAEDLKKTASSPDVIKAIEQASRREVTA